MKDIRDRTFAFSCRIVRLYRQLMRKRGADRIIGAQLIRCGTSVGSNCEEANGAHSKADFIAKMRIALKEARESHYWLRLIEATDVMTSNQIHPLIDEANEIVAILTTIVKKTNSS